MPTGRALHYERFDWAALKHGVALKPPEDAHRAYIAAENGTIRWAYSIDAEINTHNGVGMPLEPGYHEEFDTDLQYLQLWAGQTDVIAHVYYFRAA